MKKKMCYTAKHPDHIGYCAFIENDSTRKIFINKSLEDWKRFGYIIDYVPMDVAKKGFHEYCIELLENIRKEANKK